MNDPRWPPRQTIISILYEFRASNGEDAELAADAILEAVPINEALEAGDLIVRRFAGRQGRTVRRSDVLALDELMFTIAGIHAALGRAMDEGDVVEHRADRFEIALRKIIEAATDSRDPGDPLMVGTCYERDIDRVRLIARAALEGKPEEPLTGCRLPEDRSMADVLRDQDALIESEDKEKT
jgi:hypothetical protein